MIGQRGQQLGQSPGEGSEPEPEGSRAELTSEVKGHMYLLVHFRGWPDRSQGADCVFVQIYAILRSVSEL